MLDQKLARKMTGERLLFDYLHNNATYRFVIIPRATSVITGFVQVRNTGLSQWDTLGSG